MSRADVIIIAVVTLAAAATVRSQKAETFDAAYSRLKAGKTYGRAATGRVELPTTIGETRLDNILEVPADYDPARPIPLRVSLHGGVGREAPRPGEPPARALNNRTPAGRELVLHPRAWADSAWWRPEQVENIRRLIERVKSTYNVDESRVYVTGISDGGSGVYFLAMRDATPWAACMALNGHPLVIANPATGADGQLYSGNLVNCPLYIVNGGQDPLYPASSVTPIVDMFKRAGVAPDYTIHPEAGHNVEWWPQERPRYEAFLAAHPRAAHPARISWETERTDRYHRFRWLVIERLDRRGSDAPLEDVNSYNPTPRNRMELFDRSRPSGRVDIERQGNTFEARTRGVLLFTLLLSPDVVDFAKPVKVVVNDRVVHEAVVTKDASVLTKWHDRDRDRTMLYGAELRIQVP